MQLGSGIKQAAFLAENSDYGRPPQKGRKVFEHYGRKVVAFSFQSLAIGFYGAAGKDR
jgi:hypothetical protein